MFKSGGDLDKSGIFASNFYMVFLTLRKPLFWYTFFGRFSCKITPYPVYNLPARAKPETRPVVQRRLLSVPNCRGAVIIIAGSIGESSTIVRQRIFKPAIIVFYDLMVEHLPQQTIRDDLKC